MGLSHYIFTSDLVSKEKAKERLKEEQRWHHVHHHWKIKRVFFQLVKTKQKQKHTQHISHRTPKCFMIEGAKFPVDMLYLPSFVLSHKPSSLSCLHVKFKTAIFLEWHEFTFFSHEGESFAIKFPNLVPSPPCICKVNGKGMGTLWSHGIEFCGYGTLVYSFVLFS